MYVDPFTSIFLVWSLLPAGILLLGVLVLAGGRGEPDPTNQRGYAVYLAVTNYVTLFVVVFASFAVVVPLADYFLTDGEPVRTFEPVGFEDEFGDTLDLSQLEEFDTGDEDDTRRNEMITSVVQAFLVALPAVALYLYHRRKREDLIAAADFEHTAPWRVDRAFVYSTCFTAVVVLIVAASFSGFDAFRSIAPGVTANEFSDSDIERQQGLAGLVSFGYLMAASLFVFLHHWQLTKGERPEPSARPPSDDDLPPPPASTSAGSPI